MLGQTYAASSHDEDCDMQEPIQLLAKLLCESHELTVLAACRVSLELTPFILRSSIWRIEYFI